ncbi:MAG: 50S ribosomal protein L19 [Phycisphaeraceae bacterium]|nr:50S ribosomal protein L19 [Phycisphaeraceae bacterium]
MSHAMIQEFEARQMRTDHPEVAVGDTVDVHLKIVEGAKERIQVFNGVVIAQGGTGMNQTITVRRIVANEGVERVIPIHNPRVARIEVKRQGHVRRAKLYYLRDRVGKKRRLQDRRRGLATTTRRPQAAEAKPEAVAAGAEA